MRILTETKTESNTYLQSFSDNFVDKKVLKHRIKNAGENFVKLQTFFLDYLEKYNIPTGYLKSNENRTIVYENLSPFSFNCKISNVVDKKNSLLFSKNENEQLPLPFIEFYIDPGHKNLINESQIIAFELAPVDDLKIINRICSKVNAVLKSFFERRNFVLGELNCYFAKSNEKIVITGDFSPLGIKVLPADGNLKNYKFLKRNNFNDLKLYTEFLLELIKT